MSKKARAIFVLSMLVLGFILCNPIIAAPSVDPPVIQEVYIKNMGKAPVDKSQVLMQVNSRKSTVLGRDTVMKDVKNLVETGCFSDVKVTVEPLDDNAVNLIFFVKAKYKLAKDIVVKGAKHLSSDKIRDLMGIRVSDLFDDQDIGVSVQKLKAKYRKEYYPNASISWRIEDVAEEGLADVVLKIDEGRRSKVNKMIFQGNRMVSTKELNRLMKQRSKWDIRRFFRKKRYSVDDLEKARFEISTYYRNRGFLDVDVMFPRQIMADDGSSNISVEIKEGYLYQAGKLSIDGETLFPEKDLENVLRVKEGKPVSGALLDLSEQNIRDYYGSKGYISTIVNHGLEMKSENVVGAQDEGVRVADITFSIVEGKLTKIRNINIKGNTLTKDKVIRRELLVAPSDIFDEVKVRSSEHRLSNLGYFGGVRSYFLDTDLDDFKDLFFEVTEKSTGSFMVGAGFSSVDSLIGYTELTQSNFDLFGWPHFTGGGEKIKLSLQLGAIRKSYQVSFTEPWFLDQRLSLGFDLFHTERVYSDYDINRTGSALTLARPLPGPNRVTFKYKLEKTQLNGVSDTNAYYHIGGSEDEFMFSDETVNDVESSFRTTLTHDTRDHSFVPSRGNRSNLYGDISGGLFGFDTDLYEVGLSSIQYVPIWLDHILKLKIKYETIEPFGNTDTVPISSRFFIGGPQTLRGYSYRDVGPKVIRPKGADVSVANAKPIGGQSLGLASMEYLIPLSGTFRFACFYDIGNVWEDAYELDTGNTASSWGLGLRMNMPGFPIRIDYAWPIESDSGYTSEDRWSFWIGYDY